MAVEETDREEIETDGKECDWKPLIILAGVLLVAIGGLVLIKRSKDGNRKKALSQSEAAIAAGGDKAKKMTLDASRNLDSQEFGKDAVFDSYGNLKGYPAPAPPEDLTWEHVQANAKQKAGAAGKSAGDAVGEGIDFAPGRKPDRNFDLAGEVTSQGRNVARAVQQEFRQPPAGGGQAPMLGYSAGGGEGQAPRGPLGGRLQRVASGDDYERQAMARARAMGLLPGEGQGGAAPGQGGGNPAAGPLRSQPGQVGDMRGAGPGPTYRVLEGQHLDVVLVHGLENSFNESPVTVMVTRDFLSRDGKWVLYPAGTFLRGVAGLVGNQQQQRLFFRYHRCQFPNRKALYFPERSLPPGLHVDGTLGGVGRVNRHIWMQYWGAFMLGVVDGLAATAGGGATTYSNGTTEMSSGQYAAGRVSNQIAEVSKRLLDKYANVVPTITMKNGTRMKVYFTEDILVSGYMQTGELRWVKRDAR